MRVLVTGGAGFIGSHVVDRLLYDGYDVLCLDNFDSYYDPAQKKMNISSALKNENFELIEGDIRDRTRIQEILSKDGIDYVVHQAAQAGVRASTKNPEKTMEVNLLGTINLLQAALDSSVKKIVNASSSSVYGKVEYLPFDEEHPKNPLSPYGVSKLAAEHYCDFFKEFHGLRVTSLRYFTVYGPRMRPDLAIRIFAEKALRGGALEIFGDGTRTRDFTFIDDGVEATMKALNRGDGRSYNIGGGSRVSIGELAEKIITATGSNSKLVYSESVRGDAEHTWADNKRAQKELGWKPRVGLDVGLKRFIRWLESETPALKSKADRGTVVGT